MGKEVAVMNKPSIYGLTFESLAAWLAGHGYRSFQASRVWDWLYRKRAADFTGMTDVNPQCRDLLQEHYTLHTLTVHLKQEASDGTVKYLFRLHDGNLIETVLMRHKYGLSVCVTTQVGCSIGCSFCASGLLAKRRDLSAGEIVEQIMRVQLGLDEAGQGEVVGYVVVMGIGEPFDNYANLIDCLRVMQDPKGLALGPRHITVSTSGLAHRIREFADSGLRVNLAVSLHAADNDTRTRIMKINRAYPLEDLMMAVDYYLERTNRRITLEYIMLKDVNDRREDAQRLAELVGPRRKLIGVNLIPYNPVDEHSRYQRSGEAVMRDFYDVLKRERVNCSIRLEHGTDIEAACGQLRSKQIKLEEREGIDQAVSRQ
ncbi:MAG: radical enzyme Cfr family [Paenibacillaceae bacterium]|jgi:23S rRNA (adenine2503-C2)-methyltransferase|nr:radical enzyme Cfr family [Paenibacillaceae bacterium]